ncbi:hypothetical protein HXZ90_04115 [Acinetobacter pseudolwoffii]|nr:hypothetical protein [Acinetobacter pseudolwoffii]
MSCQFKPKTSGSLASLVQGYKNEYRKDKNNELSYFRNMDFDQALKKAAYAENKNGRKFSHQYRLPKQASEQAFKKFTEIKTEIKATQNFEQLYELLDSNLRSIQDIGDLFIFDTALRIGAKLNYLPKELIVQSGSKEGAKKLGLTVKNKRVSLEQLPSLIRENLEPYEIENFLCLYRDKFEK